MSDSGSDGHLMPGNGAVADEPIVDGFVDGGRELGINERLADVALRAPAIRFADIAVEIGRGEHYDGRKPQLVFAANAVQNLQHLKTVHSRHFQIKQNQIGKLLVVAFSVFAGTKQVVDCFSSVSNNIEATLDPACRQGPTKKSDMAWIVFGQQDAFNGHGFLPLGRFIGNACGRPRGAAPSRRLALIAGTGRFVAETNRISGVPAQRERSEPNEIPSE